MKSLQSFAILFAGSVCLGAEHSGSITTEEMDRYLIDLAQNVWEKVKDRGLSNMPDVDTRVVFNSSMIAGYTIVGTLYLEDGFVQEMTGIDTLSRTKSLSNYPTHTTIKSEMTFLDLTCLRTFRFVPQEPSSFFPQKTGWVQVKPKHYRFAFSVINNLTTNEIIPYIESQMSEVGDLPLLFSPLNELTSRLRKLYFGGLSGQYPVFEGLFDLWRPIFQEFLKTATKEIPYPAVEFPARSRG